MLKKELAATFKHSVFVMAFFAFVPLLFITDQVAYNTGLTFIEYMSNGLDMFILILATYLAYNIFKPEDEDGATEYLLSLPIGRWQLFKYKVLPRTGVMLVLLMIGLTLNHLRISSGSALGSVFLNWNAGILYLIGFASFVLICGFMLGLVGRKSWSVRLALLVMVICVWQCGTFSVAVKRLLFKVSDFRTAIRFSFWLGSNGSAILDFTVFFVLLWYILKPLCGIWDLGSMRTRETWFQKRMLLPLAVFLLLFLNRWLLVDHSIPLIGYH